jgi:hypothetical protein
MKREGIGTRTPPAPKKEEDKEETERLEKLKGR